MRDVNFLEVGMENFGPYIDPMILTFINNSLTLLTGPNGIGKTMALDAISFTLYGGTSKGAKGDDVVNNVIGRNCKTWVKFMIDTDLYEVIRYHKYTKIGNTVTISQNSADPYKKGSKEVLPEIERLLCPKKSFMNTLMFGQKVKDFFTDLIDSDKKEIFRKILTLDKYQNFYQQAKKVLDAILQSVVDTGNDIRVKTQLLQDSEEQLKVLNEQKNQYYLTREKEIKELQQSIQSSKRMLEQWNKKLESLKEIQKQWKDFEDKFSELQNSQGQIDLKYQDDINKLENQKQLKISQLRTDAAKAKGEINEHWSKKNQELSDNYLKIKTDINDEVQTLLEVKGEFNTLASQAQERIMLAEMQITELSVGLDEATCPTCLQVITDECKQNLENKISDNNNMIEENNLTVENLKLQRNTIIKQIEDLNTKAEKAKEVYKTDLADHEMFCKQQLQEADHKLLTAIGKVEVLSSQMEAKLTTKYQLDLEPIEFAMKEMKTKEDNFRSVDTEIDETEMSINSLQRSILQKELDIASKENKEFDETQIFSYEKKSREYAIVLKELQDKMTTLAEDQEVYEFWKLAFSPKGIPSMLIDEAIPFMNLKVAEYLERLTNGRYIVSFDTLAETKGGEFRDKISVNVLDTHTRANSRIQLSGGQTRIIDIATILTLGDLQSNIQDVRFNILLFDEIFDSLDEENIGFVSKVLTNMKIGKSIYLISHRHEDQLEADEVLTLN